MNVYRSHYKGTHLGCPRELLNVFCFGSLPLRCVQLPSGYSQRSMVCRKIKTHRQRWMFTKDTRNGGDASWLGRSFRLTQLMLICLTWWWCNNLEMSQCSLLASQDYWFLSNLNTSTPLSCSIYRDLNLSLCFLCESPLNQACIINVCSDLPTLSKCNQETHTTCSCSFVPVLFALACGDSSFWRFCLEIKGTGQVEDALLDRRDQSTWAAHLKAWERTDSRSKLSEMRQKAFHNSRNVKNGLDRKEPPGKVT